MAVKNTLSLYGDSRNGGKTKPKLQEEKTDEQKRVETERLLDTTVDNGGGYHTSGVAETAAEFGLDVTDGKGEIDENAVYLQETPSVNGSPSDIGALFASFYNSAKAPTPVADSSYFDNAVNKSNDLYEMNKRYTEELARNWDRQYESAERGPLGQDWYDALMGTYRERGEKATGAAIAGNAANNGGNVDSYAQQQAQRQMLAFENAGNAAAIDQYNAIQNMLAQSVQGKSNTIAGMIANGQNNVNSDYTYGSQVYQAGLNADSSNYQSFVNSIQKALGDIAQSEADKVKATEATNQANAEALGKILAAQAGNGDISAALAEYFPSASQQNGGTVNVTDSGSNNYKYNNPAEMFWDMLDKVNADHSLAYMTDFMETIKNISDENGFAWNDAIQNAYSQYVQKILNGTYTGNRQQTPQAILAATYR